MATAPGANLLARYNAGTASPNKLNLGSILNYSLGQEKLAYDREKELQEAQDASDRTATLSGILKGMGSQGFDRLGSEQTEAILMQNPDYAKLSDEAKLTARNQFIQNNPGLAADPRLFKGHLRDSLAGVTNQRGQRLFSVEDIDNIVDTQYKRRYPGMSDQQLEAMTKVITEANKGGNKIFNIVPGADGGVQVSSGRGGSGTFRGQYNVGNPQDRLDMAKSVGELRNLSRTPWTVPIAGNRIDFGNLDPAVTDVADVMGRMATLPGENAIVSSSAMEAALDVAFNPDQTVKEKYDWRTPEGFKNLHQKALEAQRAETQKFNTKTGSAQSADQLVQSLAGQLSVGG